MLREYCDERVCVGLFVCEHLSGTIRPNFTKLLCTLPVAVARFSTDSFAIRYVVTVLWMTS